MDEEKSSSDEPPGEPTTPTLWHRLLGKFLELLLTPVAISVQTEVQVMSEPPKVDILLLRRQEAHWTPEQRRLLPDGVRTSRASHILLECKLTESFNEASIQQALGYDYLYRQAQQLGRNDVQTFILSARTPRSPMLQAFGYQPTGLPGVYESSQRVVQPISLLLLNELAGEAHNAFVQCFASRQRMRAAALRRLGQIPWESLSEAFWDYLAGLRINLVQKEDNMIYRNANEGLTPEKVMETGRQLRKALLATLTTEEKLARLTVEERLAGLAPEERLAGLAPEERLAGLTLEERLAGLAPEELAGLLEQIEAYLRAHKARKEQ